MVMVPQGRCHKCCNGHNRAARRKGGGPKTRLKSWTWLLITFSKAYKKKL